jgi:hypothetical protein
MELFLQTGHGTKDQIEKKDAANSFMAGVVYSGNIL